MLRSEIKEAISFFIFFCGLAAGIGAVGLTVIAIILVANAVGV